MEIYKTKKLKKALDEISSQCENTKSREICGLLGEKDGLYIVKQCQNVSRNPSEEFILDPVEFLMFKDENDLLALYHSHVVGNEDASDFDIVMSENSCVSFLIYSINTKKFNLYKPKYTECCDNLLKKLKEKIK